MPAHHSNPAVHHSPVSAPAPPEMARAQTIKRNVVAFLFYLIASLFFFGLMAYNAYHNIENWNIISMVPNLRTIAVADFIVNLCYVITLGLGAFKQDWLLANASLKLSPLIINLLGMRVLVVLGAFRMDWLLTGKGPLKFSPLIIALILVPITIILAVGSIYREFCYEFFLDKFLPVRILLYFVLAYWEGSRPYSYPDHN